MDREELEQKIIEAETMISLVVHKKMPMGRNDFSNLKCWLKNAKEVLGWKKEGQAYKNTISKEHIFYW